MSVTFAASHAMFVHLASAAPLSVTLTAVRHPLHSTGEPNDQFVTKGEPNDHFVTKRAEPPTLSNEIDATASISSPVDPTADRCVTKWT